MPDVRQYRKSPVTVSAIELTQYGDFIRAVRWIKDNGGEAVFSPKLSDDDTDYLIIETLEGTFEVGTGHFIIQGVMGEFYPCRSDIFEATYEPVNEPVAAVTNSGLYIGGQYIPSQGSHLTGGAALPIP